MNTNKYLGVLFLAAAFTMISGCGKNPLLSIPEASISSSSSGGSGGSSSINGTAYWAYQIVKPVATAWQADSYLSNLRGDDDINYKGAGTWWFIFSSATANQTRFYIVTTDGKVSAPTTGAYFADASLELPGFDLKTDNSDVWISDIKKFNPIYVTSPMSLLSSSSNSNFYTIHVTSTKYPTTNFTIQILPSYKVTKN